MLFLNVGLVFMLACAMIYYKIGEMEHGGGLILAVVSVGLWVVSSRVLHLWILGCILMQVGLFVALTVWNVIRNK